MRFLFFFLLFSEGVYAQPALESQPLSPESGMQLHLLVARPKLDDAAFGLGQPFRLGVLGSVRYALTKPDARGLRLSTAIELAYREHKIDHQRTGFYRADTYAQVPLLLSRSVPMNPSGTSRLEPLIGVAVGALANRYQIAQDSAGNIQRSDYQFDYGFGTFIAAFGWATTSASGTVHRFGFRAMTDGWTLFDKHKTPATKYDSYSVYYVFTPLSRR